MSSYCFTIYKVSFNDPEYEILTLEWKEQKTLENRLKVVQILAAGKSCINRLEFVNLIWGIVLFLDGLIFE